MLGHVCVTKVCCALVVQAFFEANRSSPLLQSEDPKYSGAALWAKGLQANMENDFTAMSTLHFMAPCKEQQLALDTYRVRAVLVELDGGWCLS